METWIREYRAEHPAAAVWAEGSSSVRHDEQTQGRIFRMAQQLGARPEMFDSVPLFSILQALDEVVDGETAPAGQPRASVAAAAAVTGYKLIFGKLPALEAHGWPRGFDPVDSGEEELARRSLGERGYDPLVIDGTDPAAYLWAMFEMRLRQLACFEVIHAREEEPRLPRCLAVVPAHTPSVGSAFAHRRGQLVNVGS